MRAHLAHLDRLLVVGVLAAPVACVDLTHEDQVQALGPEAPNIAVGPLHRPGQPCLVCHGGSGPAKLQLTIAGTVFTNQFATDPAVNATVLIEDINGTMFTATTNATGNFFATTTDWQPKYPLEVNSVLLPGASFPSQMMTKILREGSCAACHSLTAGPTSPGPVYGQLAQPMMNMAPMSNEAGP